MNNQNSRMNFKKQTQEIVGSKYRYALFYNFPRGLRFELSIGTSPLDQALTALRRATVVCDDVFAGEEHVLVHLESYAPPSPFALRPMLREFQVAGIFVPKIRDIWLDDDDQTDDDDDGSATFVSCAFKVPATKMQNLLWCAIASDLGPLRPKPCCRVYLLNINKGIVVHPYDDRGMDVISQSTTTLTGLYERHHDWLLNHDIDAMRKTVART